MFSRTAGAAADATRSGTESRDEKAVARSSARRSIADGYAHAQMRSSSNNLAMVVQLTS